MSEAGERIWLITGASRGIGLAVAHRAIACGDKVAVVSRSAFSDEVLDSHADQYLGLQADVGDAEQMRSVAEQVNSKWGCIDVVVNNAGVHRGGRIGRLKAEDWNDVLATNLTGAMNTIQACDPYFSEPASVVNVGAVVGFRGFPGDSAYAASKAGLSGLTRALAVEYAPRKICVNLVIPGLVLTEMTSGLTDASLQSMLGMVPMGRTAEPDEIAQVIQSVSESRYMTGAFVPVDGGLMSTFGLPS